MLIKASKGLVVAVAITFFASVNGCASRSAAGGTVSTPEELQQAIDNAGPGDVIVLAPKTFTGTFTASRSGSEGAPITIKPTDEKTKIVGSGEHETCFVVSGNYWVLKALSISNYDVGVSVTGTNNHLDALAMESVGKGVEIAGDHNTVNACALRASQSAIIVKANKSVLNANAINAPSYSIITEGNTCCGRIKSNTINGGTTELKGSGYVLESNVIKGHLNVVGCGNSFKNEVDVAPAFLTKCENPDMGGNIFEPPSF